MKCALTGHRDLPSDFNTNALYDSLEELIKEGYDTFYCGMARGFDLLALDCLVALRLKYKLHLVACVPFHGHEMSFARAEREKYLALLSWCDEKKELSPQYSPQVYFIRDRYMVDCADLVFAYCNRATGGTAYTLTYARKAGIPVKYFE